MGKNLKGKECGKGICQRKDGLYFARYVDSLGKRHDKYFHTLSEARNWLKQAKEATAPQNDLFIPSEMTVDTWFEFWITNIVGDLAPNTIRNYRERYKHNIQPVIGQMRLVDVKQNGFQQDGGHLRRLHHPSDLYCNGYHVPFRRNE